MMDSLTHLSEGCELKILHTLYQAMYYDSILILKKKEGFKLIQSYCALESSTL